MTSRSEADGTAPVIAGYEILETLTRGPDVLVLRARRTTDGQPSVLKLPAAALPDPELCARLRREFELARRVSSSRVVRALALEGTGQRPVLCLENFGGVPLSEAIPRTMADLGEFLRLAIPLVEALGDVHRSGIVHRNLNPTSVIVELASGRVKIADFGIASTLESERQESPSAGTLEGTLAYIAPEQTGRTNRAIDLRADFYALGATFYQMLTGHVPFEVEDPLELLYAHLARSPAPPHLLNPRVPATLSAIVLKLLAKSAEDRYQSCFGIEADLRRAQADLRAGGRVADFAIGENDVAESLRIPQRLYGRDDALAVLESMRDRAGAGERPFVLVEGAPGVGKSALVAELEHRVVAGMGTFAGGKFERLGRSAPYSALLHVFDRLLRDVLARGDHEVAARRRQLASVLGDGVAAISSVLPALELLIGTQPEPQVLPPAESQRRFESALCALARAFGSAEAPLVLFLDDLQWADPSSLRLLGVLLRDAGLRHVALLGAFREGEVTASHPLVLLLDTLAKEGLSAERLHLHPLRLPDVCALVADTLHKAPEDVAELAELCLQKTDGNPFFLRELLVRLQDEGAVAFEPAARTWRLDLERVRTLDISDNVVDLMTETLSRFSAATRQALLHAACIGQLFDLETLARVGERPARTALAELLPALQAGLVAPLDGRYKLLEASEEGGAAADVVTPASVRFMFTHDRIQEAAYSLAGEARMPALHRHIGQILRARSEGSDPGKTLFAAVKHLNLGRALAKGEGERRELAELNLRAGRRARNEAAPEVAIGYLDTGIELLGDGGWDRCYDLSLALHVAAAEARYLTGDFAATARLAGDVHRRARSVLDRVKIGEIEVLAAIAQHQSLRAVEIGVAGLALLGDRLPLRPRNRQMRIAALRARLALLGRGIEAMAENPTLRDPHDLARVRLLSLVVSASSFALPRLLILVNSRLVRLSARWRTPLSAFTHVSYAAFLAAAGGEVDTFYRLGRLGLTLLESSRDQEFEGRSRWLFGHAIAHWKDPLVDTLPILREAYEKSLAAGDPEYAAYSAFALSLHTWCLGTELSEMQRVLERDAEAIERTGQVTVMQWQRIYQQMVANLLDDAAQPWLLVGEHYDETTVARDRHTRVGGVDFHLELTKMRLAYLFGQPEIASEAARQAARSMRVNFVASPVVPHFHFFRALSSFARAAGLRGSARRRLLRIATQDRRRIARWARAVPANHAHHALLLDAEDARLRGDRARARDLYDRAITCAHDNGFVQDEALAAELAGRFYLGLGERRVAGLYMREARLAYRRWQAHSKVADLDRRYPELLRGVEPALRGAHAADRSTTRLASSTLDLASLGKASQAISREIVLNRLLERMMHIAIENAGAERGLLVLSSEGRLVVRARAEAGGAGTTLVEGLVLDEDAALESRLPAAIVRYVSRSREPVRLDAATREGRFANDPYVLGQGVRSVLCLPLLKQGELVGVLYLENNLTEAAFPPERVEILSLLSSQMAISIENARLYENVTSLLDEVTNVKNYNESMLQSMSNGVITFDGGRHIVKCNDAALSLLGRTADQVGSAPIEEVLCRHNPWLRDMVAATLRDGRPDFSADCELLMPNGERTSVNLTSLPLMNARGQPIGGMLVLEDLGAEKRLKMTFGRYLSREIVDELLNSPEGLRLGGEERTVTFLVSDLRGFSALSAAVPPGRVIEVLNRYLERMVDVIHQHRGTVDEFQGDGILAFFGAPLAAPDDPERAVACAVEMQKALGAVNAELREQGLPTLSMGVGINTGPAIVGNIGSERRAKYGAVGNAINTAYRIESYTVGGQILVSPSTHALVADALQVRGRIEVELKGVGGPMTLHDVVGLSGAYATRLPEDPPETLESLCEPLAVQCFLVDSKTVAERPVPGRLLKVGLSLAEIRIVGEAKPHANLKVVLTPGGSLPDTYAKVLPLASEPEGVGGGALRVRFTWLPDEARRFLAELPRSNA